VLRSVACCERPLQEQFRVLRQAGTEMAGSHEYDKFMPDSGVFACAGCAPLFPRQVA
jgi:peptide methionine sulfoxide reductase MsrB